jgi:integrase
MKVWPDTDGSAIARHLGQLRLRTRQARNTYRSVLRRFQDAMVRHRCSSSVSREAFEAWLRKRAAHRRVSTVLFCACIVDRFLDFLAKEGSIARNPLAELRAEYGVRSRKPILRALLAPEPDRALEALRQLPPFGSVLGGLMRDRIALMRTRGYRYDTQARRFLRFDRFLQQHPELAEAPVAVMLQSWAATRSTPHHTAECEQLGRELAKARRHLDPSVALPRLNPRLQQEVRRQHRQPHIYSPDDVRRLLDAARAHPSPRAPLRPRSLYTMLVLAYCAGLRLSEIARLDLGDVDLQAGTIAIRDTKFFKSRILPLAATVVAALRDYIGARRQAGAPQDAASGLFWHDHGNRRYARQSIAWLVVDVLRRVGLKPPRGKTGPRIHDLRHSMVVNRMTAWYRAGVNPQQRLPYLATYLGHRDINSTLTYITVTQDLLHEAGERFRTFGARCLQTNKGVPS